MKKDTNAHRVGKVRFEANLFTHEADLLAAAMAKSGCKTKKELFVLMLERFNKGVL